MFISGFFFVHSIILISRKCVSQYTSHAFTDFLQCYKWIKASLQSIQLLRKMQNAQLSKCVPQLSIKIVGLSLDHHLRSSGERNGAQRRTKVSFGRTMMQALELLRLVKRHVS